MALISDFLRQATDDPKFLEDYYVDPIGRMKREGLEMWQMTLIMNGSPAEVRAAIEEEGANSVYILRMIPS
jgi:hypothetical protein